MIDKRLNNIKCSDITKNFDMTNDSTIYDVNNLNLTDISGHGMDILKMYVCIAEQESQKYGSTLQSYIAPFGIKINIYILTNSFYVLTDPISKV